MSRGIAVYGLIKRATCTSLQRLLKMVGREYKRTKNRTMQPTLKNIAGHQGPVKIELLKGAGRLIKHSFIGKSFSPLPPTFY